MTDQTHRHFHDELAHLKERVLHMAGRVEDRVARAAEAFLDRDAELGLQVIQSDGEIDDLEIEVANTVTSLLALHQPVARDLRLILASLKISNDLERVADHAVNIAQSARNLARQGADSPDPSLQEMAQCAREMLAGALEAFVKGDSQAGRAVCQKDDEVDDFNRSIFRMMVARIHEDSSSIDQAMELMRVSRNLERIADLATNVAEDVVFLIEGTTIMHHAEEQSE